MGSCISHPWTGNQIVLTPKTRRTVPNFLTTVSKESNIFAPMPGFALDTILLARRAEQMNPQLARIERLIAAECTLDRSDHPFHYTCRALIIQILVLACFLLSSALLLAGPSKLGFRVPQDAHFGSVAESMSRICKAQRG